MILNIKDKKNNQTTVSDADGEITTLGLTDNAGNSFPAFSVYPRIGISLSTSGTDVKFYLSCFPLCFLFCF